MAAGRVADNDIVQTVTMLVLPLAVLALRCLVGAGLASLLAARLPRDAQAALVPVVGSAVLVVASQLLKLGVPVRPLFLLAVAAGAAVTLSRLRPSFVALRHGLVPLGVALAAILLTGLPALAAGDWFAATWGNADPYLWVSQARAYLDGAAAPGAPDRLAFERIDELHWRVALAFGVARVALVGGADPVQVYGAFVVVVSTLVPLTAYAAARACLGLGKLAAAAASLALVANAHLLYASFDGWQAQLKLTAFALGAAAALSLGLRARGRRRELALAGLLGGATLASYGPAAAAFLALATGSVLAATVVRERCLVRALRSYAVAGGIAAGLALPALADTARSVGNVAGQLDSEGWARLARPLPSEPLGLLARDGWLGPDASAAWTLSGVALAVGLLALGVVAAARADRHELVLGPALAVLAGAATLDASGQTPYASLKLLGYGTPFLVLLVAAGLVHAPRRVAVPALAAAAVLAAGSTGAVLDAGLERNVSARELSSVTAAVARLPGDASVSIGAADPWTQSWALYFLRDRELSVTSPSMYLTGVGWNRPDEEFDHGPGDYRLAADGGSDALWLGAGLSLRRAG